MKPNNHPNQNKEPEDGFQSLGSLFDALPGSLRDCLGTDPDEAGAEPPDAPPKISAPKAKQPSAELVKAAAHIQGQPTRAEQAYLARELVQCTLPLRDPGNQTVWTRKNGNFTLILQSGIDGKTLKPIGLPYGEWARLLLLWIITEAKKTGSRHLKLGLSFTEFVRLVGGDPDSRGGRLGDAQRLKEQMLRLLACHIDFQYNYGDAQDGGRANVPMKVAPKYRLWWSSNNADQDTTLESDLILGEEFYESVVSNPVLVNLRVVAKLKKELKQASFAIDLYIWVSWRIFKMREKGIKEVIIPLESLEKQFGSEFGRTLDFKKQLINGLKIVQLFVPALDFKFTKSSFYLIDAGDLALPPTKRAARERLARLQPHNKISHQTRARFTRAYPDHDIETAITAFHDWRKKHGIEAQNINALFWAFAQTWTKNNPA